MNDQISGTVQGRPKTLGEAKLWMLEKLRARAHPMVVLDAVEGVPLIEGLTGLDPVSWTQTWRPAGDAIRAEAKAAAERGDGKEAERLYLKASGLYFMGRFPSPNHPAKRECAALERETYVAAAQYWRAPISRVCIPFAGRPDEGDKVIFYLRRPEGVERPPVVIMWGGVDAWKEQMTVASDALLAKGVATIAMDNAGTGEAPVKGVIDAERQFIAVLDWAAAQENLDAARSGLLGRSFGGYWATKLAHMVPDKVAGAVNWGGGAHFMFQPGWIEASRHPDSYLMDLVETRMLMLGATDDAGYIDGFRILSLLDQGWLDRSCAPLLLVNGKEDRQCPIADVHLLTEHGSPKSVRLFPGGHMGHTPLTLPTIVDWLVAHVEQARSGK